MPKQQILIVVYLFNLLSDIAYKQGKHKVYYKKKIVKKK